MRFSPLACISCFARFTTQNTQRVFPDNLQKKQLRMHKITRQYF